MLQLQIQHTVSLRNSAIWTWIESVRAGEGGEGREGLPYLSEEGMTLFGPGHESISRLVVLVSLKGGCLAVMGARVLVAHEWRVGAGVGWQG